MILFLGAQTIIPTVHRQSEFICCCLFDFIKSVGNFDIICYWKVWHSTDGSYVL